MTPDSQELSNRERLLRYLDAALSEEDCQEVEAWLKEDARARALLAEMAEQAVVVADLGRSEGAASKTNGSLKVTAFPNLRLPLWLGVAAVLVACFAVGALLLSPEPDSTIARLEFVSPDVEFSPNHQLERRAGRKLDKGWVHLERGELRIRFQSGATVELEGPAAFGIDTPMRSYLEYGHVSVFAPESARDFVVATESMEVVDLGTRFEVDVDPETRESNVSVSEGLVDLHLGSRGTERRIRPLEAGFSARVDLTGDIVEITKNKRRLKSETAVDPFLLEHWTFNQPLQKNSQLDLVPGVSGNALRFNGESQVDLSEHIAKLSRTESFSLSLWVRDPSAPMAMLFSLSGESEQSRIQCHLAKKYVIYGWQNGLHYDSISGRIDGWENGRWYHVAVVFRDGVVRLYRDGLLIGSGSVGGKIGTPVGNPSTVENATRAYLGRLHDGRQGEEAASQWFGGQIDDVQFYSGALDEDAIQFIYQYPGEPWAPKSK